MVTIFDTMNHLNTYKPYSGIPKFSHVDDSIWCISFPWWISHDWLDKLIHQCFNGHFWSVRQNQCNYAQSNDFVKGFREGSENAKIMTFELKAFATILKMSHRFWICFVSLYVHAELRCRCIFRQWAIF